MSKISLNQGLSHGRADAVARHSYLSGRGQWDAGAQSMGWRPLACRF